MEILSNYCVSFYQDKPSIPLCDVYSEKQQYSEKTVSSDNSDRLNKSIFEILSS